MIVGCYTPFIMPRLYPNIFIPVSACFYMAKATIPVALVPIALFFDEPIPIPPRQIWLNIDLPGNRALMLIEIHRM